jgi:hypothetical protein
LPAAPGVIAPDAGAAGWAWGLPAPARPVVLPAVPSKTDDVALPAFGGVRMAQGAAQLAALLGTHLGAALPDAPPALSDEPAFTLLDQPAGGSRSPGGLDAPGDWAAPRAMGEAPPTEGEAADIEQILEALTDELELAFIRMYGTSGR